MNAQGDHPSRGSSEQSASLEVEDRSGEAQDTSGNITGPQAEDTDRAPEEENASPLPGDPRAPNEQQPPFKEQY